MASQKDSDPTELYEGENESKLDTKIINLDLNHLEDQFFSLPVNLLLSGQVVAFPTETVYGLGANALNPSAVQKIFQTKKRPQDNPLIVHVSDMKMLNRIVKEIPPMAQELINKFWPGPLTLLFEKSELVPECVVCGQPTVAVRMPSHPVALKLISLTGVPIAAPSANISGKPSPTTAEHVFEDLQGRCPCIINGGPAQGGVESTVVDITRGLILRPGVITLEQLKSHFPGIRNYSKTKDGDLSEKPPTPGLKYRHYSPKADVLVIEGDLKKMQEKILELLTQFQGQRVGIIHTQPLIQLNESILKAPRVYIIKLGNFEPNSQSVDMKEVARGLFGALRELDTHGVDLIIMEGVHEKEEGLAVMNRIRKAAKEIILL